MRHSFLYVGEYVDEYVTSGDPGQPGTDEHRSGDPVIEFRPIEPMLFTAEEAAVFLRLDEGGDIERAVKALYRYVDRGELHPAVVGQHRRFSRQELDRFIKAKTAAHSNAD